MTYMYQEYPDWACIQEGGDAISCAKTTFVRSVWSNLDNLPVFGRKGWSGKLSVDVYSINNPGDDCWSATEIHTPLGILEPNFDEDKGKFKNTEMPGVILVGENNDNVLGHSVDLSYINAESEREIISCCVLHNTP